MIDLSNTVRALEGYDATAEGRDLMLEAARSKADVMNWELAERTALQTVQLAFWEDTKDWNNLDNCQCIGIETLRGMVASLHQEGAPG